MAPTSLDWTGGRQATDIAEDNRNKGAQRSSNTGAACLNSTFILAIQYFGLIADNDSAALETSVVCQPSLQNSGSLCWAHLP